jgi:Family of unknown function (DUF6183)
VDPAVQELVASLRGVESVTEQWDAVDEWAAQGDVDLLSEAARALIDPPAAVAEWAASAVFDRIARRFALTPELEFAVAARELARLRDPRELASVAAYGQPVDVCADLVAGGERADREFLACLVQELVLRVEHLDRGPFATFWRDAERLAHPLAWLPLRLGTIEATITLPAYAVDSTAVGMAQPLVAEGASEAAEAPPLGVERPAPADIGAAVTTWGGRAETRVFWLQPDQPHRPPAAVLEDAALECLRGAPPSRVVSATPGGVFEILFSAAADGGAYDRGHYGAYGRLAAWRTLGALAGAGAEQPFEDVADLAERTSWLGFATDTDWFFDVAWDIGIAAVSADGAQLAVLAASDTD